MKIVGIVRYAIPNAFNGIKVAGVKSRVLEKLYEDPYFTDRFNIFCNITLESFANQTDKDFVLCVYHTDQIPESRKQLFNKIEKKYPFVRCVYIPDDKLLIPEDLKEEKILTFRIDNDDGVAADFIENLRKFISTNEINFAITIPRIRKIVRLSEDTFKTITANYPSNSIGLAYYTNEDKTIMDLGNHTNIHVRFPTKRLSNYGGLQIINSYNVANKFEKQNNNWKDQKVLNKNQMEDLLVKENYLIGDLSCLPICKGESNGKSISNSSNLQRRKVFKRKSEFNY